MTPADIGTAFALLDLVDRARTSILHVRQLRAAGVTDEQLLAYLEGTARVLDGLEQLDLRELNTVPAGDVTP
ncbi:MAG: hypothetical protein AAGG11_24120 [Pseudomonadota bacterium]